MLNQLITSCTALCKCAYLEQNTIIPAVIHGLTVYQIAVTKIQKKKKNTNRRTSQNLFVRQSYLHSFHSQNEAPFLWCLRFLR